jgi:hypothetical protein
MDNRDPQDKLAHDVVFSIMGLSDIREVCHGIYAFSTSVWYQVVLPIECEIPSLKLVIELLPHTSAEEECLLYLMRLDETRRDATLVIETQKKRMKSQYDKHVKPHVFSEGDLVLLYEQDHDLLGAKNLRLCGATLISLNECWRRELMS